VSKQQITEAIGGADAGLSANAVEVYISRLRGKLENSGVRIRTSAEGTGLAEERFNQGRFFGGINVNLIALNLAFEAEKMGDNLSLSAKLGWRF